MCSSYVGNGPVYRKPFLVIIPCSFSTSCAHARIWGTLPKDRFHASSTQATHGKAAFLVKLQSSISCAVAAGTASSITMKRRQFLRPIHLIVLQRKAVGEGGGRDWVSVACPASCLQTLAWKLDNSLIFANQPALWMSVSLQHSTTLRKECERVQHNAQQAQQHTSGPWCWFAFCLSSLRFVGAL